MQLVLSPVQSSPSPTPGPESNHRLGISYFGLRAVITVLSHALVEKVQDVAIKKDEMDVEKVQDEIISLPCQLPFFTCYNIYDESISKWYFFSQFHGLYIL